MMYIMYDIHAGQAQWGHDVDTFGTRHRVWGRDIDIHVCEKNMVNTIFTIHQGKEYGDVTLILSEQGLSLDESGTQVSNM